MMMSKLSTPPQIEEESVEEEFPPTNEEIEKARESVQNSTYVPDTDFARLMNRYIRHSTVSLVHRQTASIIRFTAKRKHSEMTTQRQTTRHGKGCSTSVRTSSKLYPNISTSEHHDTGSERSRPSQTRHCSGPENFSGSY